MHLLDILTAYFAYVHSARFFAYVHFPIFLQVLHFCFLHLDICKKNHSLYPHFSLLLDIYIFS